eukprot:TRINITY_DN7295_c0_g1_i1.p1 TRINITY_DN7295_c0_g1~~TRINITY_DN7295_c0_g1_i1.p1  ORF type:complete len:442 (-),score=110.47 TRINITY_DN7295_c0_g1_i1:4-1329(-)
MFSRIQSLLLCLAFVAFAFCEVRVPLSDTINHFEPLSAVSIQSSSCLSDVCSSSQLGQARITFEAFGRTFDHLIEPNLDLFTPQSMIVVTYANGTQVRRKPENHAFHGVGDDHTAVRVDSLEQGHKINLRKPIFKGFFDYDEVSFMVEPLADYLSEIPEGSLKNIPPGTQLVIYRVRDQIDYNAHCGQHSAEEDEGLHSAVHSSSSARLFNLRSVEQEVLDVLNQTAINPPPAPCPSKIFNFVISFAADAGYITKTGGTAQAEALLRANMNIIVGVYIKTTNLKLIIDEVVLQPDAGTVPWNTATCPLIADKLNQFAEWRAGRNANAGLWHLLTNCYPRGTVGLAWTGVPCLTDGFAQGADYVNGAGVSSWLSGANGWRVTCHEIGHNMGAGHAAEGIMFPSVRPTNDFSRPSQNEICAVLGRRSTDCLQDAGPCKPRTLR